MRSTLLIAAGLFIAGSTACAQARTTVTAPDMNVTATLSPGIKVGNTLYTSGQLPARGDTTIQGQTRSTLERIKTVVEAGGMKMEDVVKCTVFLINTADFSGMNSVYREFWPKDPPARSTVVIAALVVPGAKLEIECIAQRG